MAKTSPPQLPHVAIEAAVHGDLKDASRRSGIIIQRLATDAIAEYLQRYHMALRSGGKLPKGKRGAR